MSDRQPGEVVRAAIGLRDAAAEELRQLQGLHDRTVNEQAGIERARDEQGLALATALLPELSAAALAHAATLAGPVFLGRADPVAARDAERAALNEELAQHEADPRYVERELLRAPRVGQLTRQVDELLEFAAPHRELLQKASHERLPHLLEVGYDTDTYAVPWWRASFYADWKAGDEILERFPDRNRFAELRPLLEEARSTLAVFDAKLGDLRAEIEAGEAIERRVAELRDRLAGLDALHLDQARHRLRAYLLEGDMAAIGQRLAGDPALAEAFKLLRGLAAKVTYLEGIRREMARGLAQVQEVRAKAERDAIKWQRPKMQWQRLPAADFEKRYVAPRARFRKRREHWAHSADTVVVFNDYGRASFVEDFLWWDVMTDGRLDGDFIPEVAQFQREHPDYQYRRDDDDSAAAAATAHTLLSRDDDTTSAHDPS